MIKLTKENLEPKIGPKIRFFCQFLKFTSLVFLDVTEDCNLKQCLTSSKAETFEKNLWPKLGPNRRKPGQNEIFQQFPLTLFKREISY